MDVSIVINTVNRANYLSNLLNSLRFLKYPSFEVVVVNGPSTDNTIDVVNSWSNKVKYERCDELNLSKSRNIGIAAASGEIIAFIDDDAIPEPNWLQNLVPAYVNNRVAGVGGYLRNHTGVEFQCKAIVCDRRGRSKNFESYSEAVRFVETSGEGYFISPTGANSSFRASAIREIGGFDEEFEYFLDETDVNIRLIDAGYSINYASDAVVHHKYAPSHIRDEKKIPKNLYRPARSTAYYCLKHMPKNETLSNIYDHLANYIIENRRHNLWHRKNSGLTKDEHLDLDQQLKDGVFDGIRKYFSKFESASNDDRIKLNSGSKFTKFDNGFSKDSKMSVCFASREYPPEPCNGIGNWTHEVATGLADKGHNVSVVTNSSSGVHTVDFEDGVWVHRILQNYQPDREHPSLPDIPQVTKDYAFAVYDEAIRIGLSRGLDLVSAPIWDLEGIACACADDLTAVTSLHTTFGIAQKFKPEWTSNKEYYQNHVQKIIDGESKLLEKADFILANSRKIIKDINSTTKQSCSNWENKTEIVYHGISDVAKTKTRNDDKTVVLFTGRAELRKGYDTLLNVIPKLASRYDSVEFRLVGEYNISVSGVVLKEEFTKKYSTEPWFSRVVFLGFLEDSELVSEYVNADIFVCPSRYESFGLVLVEAMRHGLACIGSTSGGMEEIIEHNKDGILINPDNTSEFMTALDELITDGNKRQVFANAARQKYLKSFTSEKMIAQIEKTFSSWLAAM